MQSNNKRNIIGGLHLGAWRLSFFSNILVTPWYIFCSPHVLSLIVYILGFFLVDFTELQPGVIQVEGYVWEVIRKNSLVEVFQ